MFSTKHSNHIYFDVDDTLVMWRYASLPDENSIEFEVPDTHGTVWLEPHQEHIKKLKEHHEMGHTVIVWSAGGADWAKKVVETLGLTKYVTATLAKPTWFYDDLTAHEFMPQINRVYIPHKEESRPEIKSFTGEETDF